MLIANAAAFVALLVAYPVVGRGWFDAGGLLIVLIGVSPTCAVAAAATDPGRPPPAAAAGRDPTARPFTRWRGATYV
jgi:hypothetical protein